MIFLVASIFAKAIDAMFLYFIYKYLKKITKQSDKRHVINSNKWGSKWKEIDDIDKRSTKKEIWSKADSVMRELNYKLNFYMKLLNLELQYFEQFNLK